MHALANWTRSRFYYGWIVVGITFLIMLITAATRATHLVRQLLALARMERNAPVEITRFELRALLEQVIAGYPSSSLVADARDALTALTPPPPKPAARPTPAKSR